MRFYTILNYQLNEPFSRLSKMPKLWKIHTFPTEVAQNFSVTLIYFLKKLSHFFDPDFIWVSSVTMKHCFSVVEHQKHFSAALMHLLHAILQYMAFLSFPLTFLLSSLLQDYFLPRAPAHFFARKNPVLHDREGTKMFYKFFSDILFVKTTDFRSDERISLFPFL